MKVPTRVNRLSYLLETNTLKLLVEVALLFLQIQVDHGVVGLFSICTTRRL